MKEEFFDIVNKNNKSLDLKKSRELVHKNLTDWHRATHIWIINNKNEILCQRRSWKKDVNPGKWQSFFGGHLKTGKTYEQSALEELKEELGIKIQKRALTPLYIRKSESAKHFSQVYVVRWNGNLKQLGFNKEEVARLKWFTIGELCKAIHENKFCNVIDKKVIEYIENRDTYLKIILKKRKTNESQEEKIHSKKA